MGQNVGGNVELIEIKLTRREGSRRVIICGIGLPHPVHPSVRYSANVHADMAQPAALGEQELWELVCAIQHEIEGWAAKLPLDY